MDCRSVDCSEGDLACGRWNREKHSLNLCTLAVLPLHNIGKVLQGVLRSYRLLKDTCMTSQGINACTEGTIVS